DQRRERPAHPPHQPEQQSERSDRRQHEGPRRIDPEWIGQQVDEPEVQRRLVRERSAAQRGQKKRAGRSHLANNLSIFCLVADEEMAPRRGDQDGEKEQQDSDLQHALLRHSRAIVSTASTLCNSVIYNAVRELSRNATIAPDAVLRRRTRGCRIVSLT